MIIMQHVQFLIEAGVTCLESVRSYLAWHRAGLNRRPSGLQSDALPTELQCQDAPNCTTRSGPHGTNGEKGIIPCASDRPGSNRRP